MHQKTTYLIDTENIGIMWKNLINSNSTDKLFVFYTDNSPYISYTDLEFLIKSSSHFTMIKCFLGHNGLDFQLVSYLGHLLPLKPTKTEEFIIVSNDTGFDPVCHFWNDRGYAVKRLSMKQDVPEQQKKNQEISNIELLEKLLPSNYKKETEIIGKIIINNNLPQIHNELIKLYGRENGLKLYKILKPQIKSLL